MDENSKLYFVRRTLVQMLSDRGYLISDQLKNETLEEFLNKFVENK